MLSRFICDYPAPSKLPDLIETLQKWLIYISKKDRFYIR